MYFLIFQKPRLEHIITGVASVTVTLEGRY
jgi:hypothetical protein